MKLHVSSSCYKHVLHPLFTSSPPVLLNPKIALSNELKETNLDGSKNKLTVLWEGYCRGWGCYDRGYGLFLRNESFAATILLTYSSAVLKLLLLLYLLLPLKRPPSFSPFLCFVADTSWKGSKPTIRILDFFLVLAIISHGDNH